MSKHTFIINSDDLCIRYCNYTQPPTYSVSQFFDHLDQSMPLQTNCFSLPYGHYIPQTLAKERAWIHQSIHPVPGAPGSTPRSCNLDKAIKFLCSRVWIKACGATDYKNSTQCKTFPTPEGLQSEERGQTRNIQLVSGALARKQQNSNWATVILSYMRGLSRNSKVNAAEILCRSLCCGCHFVTLRKVHCVHQKRQKKFVLKYSLLFPHKII